MAAAAKELFTGVSTLHRGNTKDREEVPIDSLQGEVLGLYFSASWCPPCRAFTPQLAEWYNRLTASLGKGKLEIVFLSSDRKEDDFNGYFDSMPWLALPFAEKECKAKLSSKYMITGIPTLLLFDGQTGSFITKGGRAIVTDDPNGEMFPWKPPRTK